MIDLPNSVQARRTVEDRAIELGRERAALQNRDGEIIEESVTLMDEARDAGVSMEALAELLQISHPTLYRWRGAIARLRADREDGDI